MRCWSTSIPTKIDARPPSRNFIIMLDPTTALDAYRSSCKAKADRIEQFVAGRDEFGLSQHKTELCGNHGGTQCWTVGTIFTLCLSRMFGLDKLHSRSHRIKKFKTYVIKVLIVNIENKLLNFILDLKTPVRYLN